MVLLHILTVSLHYPSLGIMVADKDPLLACPFIHYYWDQASESVGNSDFVELPYKLVITGIKVVPLEEVLLLGTVLDTTVTDSRSSFANSH